MIYPAQRRLPFLDRADPLLAVEPQIAVRVPDFPFLK
jgi:hypothetical protein